MLPDCKNVITLTRTKNGIQAFLMDNTVPINLAYLDSFTSSMEYYCYTDFFSKPMVSRPIFILATESESFF